MGAAPNTNKTDELEEGSREDTDDDDEATSWTSLPEQQIEDPKPEAHAAEYNATYPLQDHHRRTTEPIATVGTTQAASEEAKALPNAGTGARGRSGSTGRKRGQ